VRCYAQNGFGNIEGDTINRNGGKIESHPWDAADQLRANSKLKSSEYSVPMLGLVFLRCAGYKFEIAAKELVGLRNGSEKLRSRMDLAGGLSELIADLALFYGRIGRGDQRCILHLATEKISVGKMSGRQCARSSRNLHITQRSSPDEMRKRDVRSSRLLLRRCWRGAETRRERNH